VQPNVACPQCGNSRTHEDPADGGHFWPGLLVLLAGLAVGGVGILIVIAHAVAPGMGFVTIGVALLALGFLIIERKPGTWHCHTCGYGWNAQTTTE
jgi:hypothetical protein